MRKNNQVQQLAFSHELSKIKIQVMLTFLIYMFYLLHIIKTVEVIHTRGVPYMQYKIRK